MICCHFHGYRIIRERAPSSHANAEGADGSRCDPAPEGSCDPGRKLDQVTTWLIMQDGAAETLTSASVFSIETSDTLLESMQPARWTSVNGSTTPLRQVGPSNLHQLRARPHLYTLRKLRSILPCVLRREGCRCAGGQAAVALSLHLRTVRRIVL
jgi:hypothetical protein